MYSLYTQVPACNFRAKGLKITPEDEASTFLRKIRDEHLPYYT
jgi:hypothetical protein